MLSRAFFAGERLKDEEIPEDNSSFAKVLTSSRMIGSFPLCDLITPSSVLLAHSISSPCPDVNGGIDPLAIGSSDWLILRLPRTNKMWEGESTKL